MQLNEILEENTIRAISQKTNISEENLEALFAGEFDVLKKVKTMGFISIIEREYHADLKPLRDQAHAYYAEHSDENGIVLDAPITERKKGRSKFLLFMVVVLLATASWYFMTQFDKEKLKGLISFEVTKSSEVLPESVDDDPNLSIEHAIADETVHENTVQITSGKVSKEVNLTHE
ncbi:membrane protein [hydrothermal vent metagenome]|uniref:Membrane protein n=1 Tax=hydrothermal vent metagenome TaxID=652676 RepID=A0A1W1E9G1_9ZZZZ